MLFAGFYTADDLCVEVKRPGDVDDGLCVRLRQVYFHAVAHVEDFIHLLPIGAALVVNQFEERWNVEQVVFDDVDVVDEVEHFGLCAAAAMHHAVDLAAQLPEHFDDDGRIGARWGQHQLACVDGRSGYGVGQATFAGIDKPRGDVAVVGLGIFYSVVFVEDVVTGGRQAVAAHAAVVFVFVGGLAEGSEAYNDIACLDVLIVDYIAAPHAADDGAIDNDGFYEVTQVGSFPTGADDVQAVAAQHGQYLFRAFDDRSDYFAWNEVFIAANGGGQ